MKKTDWAGRIKPILFLTLLAPAMMLGWLAFQNHLGPDPAKALVDQTGLWTIRILLLSLAMTPLRLFTGQSFWIRFRRMIGLFTLFSAMSHFLIYVFLLFGAEWGALARELSKRPYIIVGFSALLLMLPLGVTSTRGWQRRLGRKWVILHKLVYLLAVLGVVHFAWAKKLGLQQVWPYALVLMLLLAVRVHQAFRKRGAKAAVVTE